MSGQAMAKTDKGISYMVGGTTVELSKDVVRRYLVSGKNQVSDQEVVLFMALCKANGLNPWARDAYLVKYSDKYPASMVVSKGAYNKRAERHPEYRGFKAGIVTFTKENGADYREGCITMPGEKLVGGWATVFRSDRKEVPARSEVPIEEYHQGNKMWDTKTATMIRKVAVVQALREAFPEEYAGLYSEEEMPPHDPPMERVPVTEKVTAILAQPEKAELPAPAEKAPVVIEADKKQVEVLDEKAPASKPAPVQQGSIMDRMVEDPNPAADIQDSFKDAVNPACERFTITHVRAVHEALGWSDKFSGLTNAQKKLAVAVWGKALGYESEPPKCGTADWEAYVESLRPEEAA